MRWIGLLLCLPFTALAQDFKFEPNNDAPFVAPGSLFSVQIPNGWQAFADPQDPTTVQFQAIEKPGEGQLFIRRFAVPSGAKPRQLISVAIEERLSKLPLYKLLNRHDVKIAGNKGASTVVSYAYQGNLEYLRIVEEAAVVVGTEAYLFHFESLFEAGGAFASDLELFYHTFVPHPAGFNNEGITEQNVPPITF